MPNMKRAAFGLSVLVRLTSRSLRSNVGELKNFHFTNVAAIHLRHLTIAWAHFHGRLTVWSNSLDQLISIWSRCLGIPRKLLFTTFSAVERLKFQTEKLTYRDSIQDWENLLKRLLETLHPHHFLAMNVKRSTICFKIIIFLEHLYLPHYLATCRY